MKNDLQVSFNSKNSLHYSICHLTKQCQLPFISSNSLSKSPFQLVHYEIWGPFTPFTTEGSRYFLIIVDDRIEFTRVYLLKAKSDVITIFLDFYTLIHTQSVFPLNLSVLTMCLNCFFLSFSEPRVLFHFTRVGMP